MSQYSSKYYDIFFTSIIILTMLFGIILSMVFSKSFKQKILIPVDTLKNSYNQNEKNILEQKSVLRKIEFQNYPELSVPVIMSLGKLKKVENIYKPRLNLSYFEYAKNLYNTQNNIGFMFNPILDFNYKIF